MILFLLSIFLAMPSSHVIFDRARGDRIEFTDNPLVIRIIHPSVARINQK